MKVCFNLGLQSSPWVGRMIHSTAASMRTSSVTLRVLHSFHPNTMTLLSWLHQQWPNCLSPPTVLFLTLFCLQNPYIKLISLKKSNHWERLMSDICISNKTPMHSEHSSPSPILNSIYPQEDLYDVCHCKRRKTVTTEDIVMYFLFSLLIDVSLNIQWISQRATVPHRVTVSRRNSQAYAVSFIWKCYSKRAQNKSFKNGPSKPSSEWEETQRAIWERRLVNEARPSLSWAPVQGSETFQGLLTPCCFHSWVHCTSFYGSLLKFTIFT